MAQFFFKSLEFCGKLFENIRKRPFTAACEYLRIKERIFENLDQQTMRTFCSCLFVLFALFVVTKFFYESNQLF